MDTPDVLRFHDYQQKAVEAGRMGGRQSALQRRLPPCPHGETRHWICQVCNVNTWPSRREQLLKEWGA